jgi:hypothetical protein
MAFTTRRGFVPRDQRIIHELARWMGLLGRFQVVAATFVLLLLLAGAAVVTTIEMLDPAQAEGLPVSIGNVSRTTMAVTTVATLFVTVLFLRGGMLLISSAEDLEETSAEDARVIEHLDSALRRLRAYFVLESVLMACVAAAAYVGAFLRWPGT